MEVAICLERLNKRPYKLAISLDGTQITKWEGGDTQPTQAELEAAWAAYQAEGGRAKEDAAIERLHAYAAEADPLFFQVQRGEVEQSVYDAKIAEIKARYPYPS